MDIDLDIVNEKKTIIKLNGNPRELRDLTMDENFKVTGLRKELGEAMAKQDTKLHKKISRELLRLLIDPIDDNEIEKMTQRQFEALFQHIEFLDLRDQGVVKTMDEYNKLKADTAKTAMRRNADQVFPVM